MLKVLLLSDFTSAYSRLLLKGFLRYSMEVGNWRFYRIPLSREDFNDEKAIETVIDIAQRWGADAIMGQLSEVNTERLRTAYKVGKSNPCVSSQMTYFPRHPAKLHQSCGRHIQYYR